MSLAPVVRKRKRAEHGERLPGHRLQPADAVEHALLAQYYPKTQTLRQYLFDNLPTTSRIRRRKIEAFEAHAAENQDNLRAQLASLLDTTLVGLHPCPQETAQARSKSRLQQWIEYSQKDDSHVTISSGDASAIHSQSKVGLLTPTKLDQQTLTESGRLLTSSFGCPSRGRGHPITGRITSFAMATERVPGQASTARCLPFRASIVFTSTSESPP